MKINKIIKIKERDIDGKWNMHPSPTSKLELNYIICFLKFWQWLPTVPVLGFWSNKKRIAKNMNFMEKLKGWFINKLHSIQFDFNSVSFQ